MSAGRPREALAALAVTLVALSVRLVHLDHTPHYDEFFHILAARSWLERGTLCIANCVEPYTRAWPYTYLVVGTFRLLGESVVAARLPAVFSGALWVTAVYLWTRRVAGRTAGWAAALLLALDPGAIYLSQISRFYSLHGLAFWVGIMGLYLLGEMEEPRARRVTIVVAAAALLLAVELQITTLIGLLGVAAWFCVRNRAEVHNRLWRSLLGRSLSVGFVLLAAVAAAWIVQRGEVGALWEKYRWSTLYTARESANPGFLLDWFLAQYQWLWSLLPAAALVAWRRAPRAASYCLTVFGVAFLIHSFAGDKAFRVFYYLIPCFLAVWGIALGALLPVLRQQAVFLADYLFGSRISDQTKSVAVTAALVGMVAFAAVSTESVNLALRMMRLSDSQWSGQNVGYRGYANWSATASRLKPLVDSAAVVLSGSATKALYYLGRVDGAVSANQLFLGTTGSAPEFALDPRIGFPIVSRPSSVQLIMSCYPSGLVVVEKGLWRRPESVPPETADVVARYADSVPLGPKSDLVAFRWTRPAPGNRTSCVPPPLSQRRAVAP